jgi:peptide/nickel transport system permease protein
LTEFGPAPSLALALTALAVAVAIGVPAGLLAAVRRNTLLDRAAMLMALLGQSTPTFWSGLLAILVFAAWWRLLPASGGEAIFGPGLQTAILALVLTGWVPYARLTRAELLIMREQPFVQAGQAIEASPGRLVLRHVLPNLAPTLVVVATFSFAQMIIQESALSFLGLGIQPPQPSWGSMLSDARSYLLTAWWAGVFPGLAIMVTVLSVNVIGERLRDVLDPRLRGIG